MLIPIECHAHTVVQGEAIISSFFVIDSPRRFTHASCTVISSCDSAAPRFYSASSGSMQSGPMLVPNFRQHVSSCTVRASLRSRQSAPQDSIFAALYHRRLLPAPERQKCEQGPFSGGRQAQASVSPPLSSSVNSSFKVMVDVGNYERVLQNNLPDYEIMELLEN